MAKVSREYYEKKKAVIVEAALNVCTKKTVSSVTMQDIINATGFSQGAIYRYYSNIDEILVDLLSKVREEQLESMMRLIHIFDGKKEDINHARSLEIGKESIELRRRLVVEIMKEVHQVWAEQMSKFLYPYKKIEIEFMMLADNYPDRARYIFPRARQVVSMDDRIIEELNREIKDGVITPRIPLDEFMKYNAAVYGGIVKLAISESCYQRNAYMNENYSYDFASRFHTFAMSSAYFLGIENYM